MAIQFATTTTTATVAPKKRMKGKKSQENSESMKVNQVNFKTYTECKKKNKKFRGNCSFFRFSFLLLFLILD